MNPDKRNIIVVVLLVLRLFLVRDQGLTIDSCKYIRDTAQQCAMCTRGVKLMGNTVNAVYNVNSTHN